jgi:hypothetical protein
VFTDRTVLAFLTKLRDEPQVGDDVRDKIDAVRAVRDFLDAPELTAGTLDPVAAALTLDPAVLPPAAKDEVLEAVDAELSKRPDSPDFQRDLETVLLHLSPLTADGAPGLYRELLRRQRPRRDFGKNPNVLHAFLAVALGAAQNEDAAKRAEGLEGEAFAVAAEAGKKGGRKVLDAIDARTNEWPKAARTQWGFLIEAVRPKGLDRTVRDLVIFAAGAAAASAAWFAVAQFVK